MNQLHPTKWYYPHGAAGQPQPCQWEGWVDLGIDGRQWVVLYLTGA